MKSLNPTYIFYKFLQLSLIATCLFGLMFIAIPSAEAANSCDAPQSSKGVSGSLTSLGGSGTCQEKCTAYAKTLGTAVNCQVTSTYVPPDPFWVCDPMSGMCGWWTPTSGGTYVESCAAGTGAIVNSASNVSASSCAYVPTPTVNLTSNLSSVQNGQSVILSWTSTDALSCSGVSSGPTAGTKTQTVNAGAQSSVSYSITCLNSAGESVTDSVTISVSNPNTPASCTAWDWSKYPTGSLVTSFPVTGVTACATSCGSFAEGDAGTPYSCGLQTITDVFGIGGHNYNGSGGIITTTNTCYVMRGSDTGPNPPTTGTYEFNNGSYPTELAAGTAYDNCIRSSSGSNPISCMIETYSVTYYGATTCTSAPTGAPDLRATNVRPVSATVGTAVTLIADISNTGTAPTPTGFINRFQISSDAAGTAIVYTGTTADLAISANTTDPSSHGYTFLSAGTFYIQVCADSAAGVAESDEGNNCTGWTAVTVTTVPATPTGLAATPQACDTGTISVSWNAVSGASGYDLQIDGGAWLSLGNVTSYNHTGLSAGTSHNYSIRAWNGSGAGAASAVVNGTAPAVCIVPPPVITPTTTPPTTSNPTANISGGGCFILIGASSCTTTVTWDSQDTTGAVSVRQDGVEFASNVDQIAPFTVSVDFGSNFFTLHHNGGVQVGVSHEITASCANGSSWNGSTCVANPADPGLSLSVSPNIVRDGQTATIVWSITTPYSMSCTIFGPKIPTTTFDPTDPSAPNNIATGPITSKSEYFFRCTSGGSTWTDSAVVETVGVIEET